MTYKELFLSVINSADVPVRVSCSCGSRVWVSPTSASWLAENFIDDHWGHGLLRVQSADVVREKLRSSPVVSGA